MKIEALRSYHEDTKIHRIPRSLSAHGYSQGAIAYHPQTDGLVERLNRTLLDMLAKTVEKNGKNWDRQLPYVLFAYRASLQESTRESPFFLMYGRDPRLPSEETLSGRVRETLYMEDYRSELASGMAEAWELARANVQKAPEAAETLPRPESYRLVVPIGRACFHLHAGRETGESIQVCEAIPWPFSCDCPSRWSSLSTSHRRRECASP